MSTAKKEKWLKSRGWSQWYNPDYWVHPKTVQDSRIQDYTNYGLTLDKAIEFEKSGKPFPSVGPILRALSSLYRTESPEVHEGVKEEGK